MKKVLRKQIIEARLGISQEKRLQSSKKSNGYAYGRRTLLKG